MKTHKNRPGMRRLLAFALVLAMLLTIMPTAAFAKPGPKANGKAGSVFSGLFQSALAQPKAEPAPAAEPEPPAEEPEAPVEAPVEEPAAEEPAEEPVEAPAAPTEEPEAPAPEPEAPAAEPAPEAPAEELSPAIVQELKVGKLTVSIDAEPGAFPEGTKVKAKKADLKDVQKSVDDAEDVSGKVLVAVDITFTLKGEELQPAEGKSVKVSISAPELKDKARKAAVVHIDGETDKAEKVGDVEEVKADEVAFEAEKFSVYAVIETYVPRLTLVFHNGAEQLPTMIIKAADTADEVDEIIYEPGSGIVPEGEVFKGWTTDENYTKDSVTYSIDEVKTNSMAAVAALTEDETVNYYPAIFKQFVVTYVDSKGITIGTEVLEVPSRLTEGEYTVNQGYTTDDSHNFDGWFVDAASVASITDPANVVPIGDEDDDPTLFSNGTAITIQGNVNFTVSAPEGHWLVFDENGKGGTYNAPRFVLSGENTNGEGLLEMVRNGYTFGGWYTDAACTDGNEFSFGGPISDTTTIYAKWNAKTQADYTVLIWKQNVRGEDDNGKKLYDFVEAVHVTNAQVGSTPDRVNTTTGAVTGATKTIGSGFHFSSTDQADQEVKPEGSTVVNVYWDRDEYTLRFQIQAYTYTENANGTYGLVDGEYVQLQSTTIYTYNNGADLYTGTYFYQQTTERANNSYGIINNEVVGPLNRSGNNYSYNGTPYSGTRYYRNTSFNNNTYNLGFVDGQMVRVAQGTQMTLNGEPYTGTRYNRSNTQTWQDIQTVTALYEQPVGEYFPIVGSNGVTYDQGERWDPQSTSGTNDVIVYLDIMPDHNETFHLNVENRPLKTMNYYVEALPNSENTVSAPNTLYNYNNQSTNAPSGKVYVLYTSQSARYNGCTIEDFLALNGFTRLGSNSQRNNNGFYIYSTTNDGTVNFYYTRDAYEINFMDGGYFDGNNNPITDETNRGQLHEVLNVAYGADLTSYNKGGDDFYEPTAPAGYIFEGWYIDSACTQPYTFTTMSDGGLTVYAKWRLTQYRVFLHPMAGTDSTLDWGSDNQAMNFRVSYGGKISVPTGKRTGFEFFGWYKDPNYGQTFTANEQIRTGVAYDKTTELTDNMDKWGNIEDGSPSPVAGGNGYNSDAYAYDEDTDTFTERDRFWITQKFELWAKWSEVTVGADGIGVIYDDAEGSGAPSDTALYKDNTFASAGAAPTPPTGKLFDRWVVQTWNGTEFVDTETTVLAGATFTVLKSNARITDRNTGDVIPANELASDGVYSYVVQLKATYKDPPAEKTLTHITFYLNNGTGTIVQEYQELPINQAVNIPVLTSADYPGHDFLGWARVAEGAYDPTSTDPEQQLTPQSASYWLELNDDGTFTLMNDNVTSNSITQVAADEKDPYHDLYAVWREKDTFTVVYSHDMSTEYTFYCDEVPATINLYAGTDGLTDIEGNAVTLGVTGGRLYAGYYTAAPVNGKWNAADAGTADGRTLAPQPNTTYYVKEVDARYLSGYYTYSYVGTANPYKNQCTSMVFLSSIDDLNYSGVGFVLGQDGTYTNKTSGVKKSLRFQPAGKDAVTINASSAFRHAGYLTYFDVSTILDFDSLAEATYDENNELTGVTFSSATFQLYPYWVTLDGVPVVGTGSTVVVHVLENGVLVRPADRQNIQESVPAGVMAVLEPAAG